MRTVLKISALALAGSVAASAASAGGFSRGTADTDILFDDKNFAMRFSMTHTAPKREFTANASRGLVGTSSVQDFLVTSSAVKLDIIGGFKCAGSVSTPYGGNIKNAVASSTGILSEEFTITELGATCAYEHQLEKGSATFIGGIFRDSFDYTRVNETSLGNATLKLDGTDQGFRVGAAYEIPEIALKAQVMYRSATSYGATGSVTLPTAAVQVGALLAANPTAGFAQTVNSALGAASQALQAGADPTAAVTRIVNSAVVSGDITPAQAATLGAAGPSILSSIQTGATSVDNTAMGTGELPQSVEFKLQSGIAPGWLAFGSVKWTDWSVLEQLVVSSAVSNSSNQYFWRDGWTIGGGIAHKLNDTTSLAGSVTYDRGVGTGFDISPDTWTFAAGASITPDDNSEIRLGAAYTHIAAGNETQYVTNAATKAGHAISFSGSLKIGF